jgi:hypothetical protein
MRFARLGNFALSSASPQICNSTGTQIPLFDSVHFLDFIDPGCVPEDHGMILSLILPGAGKWL